MGNIHLSFNRFEYAAIVKLAVVMASADGKVHDNEKMMMTAESLRFGLGGEKLVEILNLAKELTPSDAISFVSKMDNIHKRYVAAYLGTMVAIDDDIDNKEIQYWTLVSTLADLPTMNIAEAQEYMSNL